MLLGDADGDWRGDGNFGGRFPLHRLVGRRARLGDRDRVERVGPERRVWAVLFSAADGDERDVDVGVTYVGPSDIRKSHTAPSPGRVV